MMDDAAESGAAGPGWARLEKDTANAFHFSPEIERTFMRSARQNDRIIR